MEEIFSKFWKLITMFGGLTIVTTGSSVWLSSIIFERLRQRSLRKTALEVEEIRTNTSFDLQALKKTIDIDLENFKKNSTLEIEDLKGSIGKNNSIVTTLLGHQGQSYQKVLEKRIEAIQIVWEGVLEIKSLIPPIVSLVYDILAESELANDRLDKIGKSEIIDRESFGEMIAKLDYTSVLSKFGPISDRFNKLRPFLTQKLSILLFVYNAVIGRTILLLTEGYRRQHVKAWSKDDGIQQLLTTVLNEEENNYIYNKAQGLQSFSSVIDLLQTKILNEINIMLSGDKLTDDTITQVEKLNKIFGSNNRSSPPAS